MARVVSGPEITGQVVSRQTGSPIAGATVTVSATVYTDPDFTSGTTTLTCDGSGVFFCYAGNGTYTFTTTARGAAPIESVTVRGTGGGGSGSGASVSPAITSIVRNADGTTQSITYANGVTLTYTYNADGSVATESDGTTTRTFAYNGDGTLASVA